MLSQVVNSLFLFHLGSNAGYAISSLEKLFYRAGLALAEGDPSAVHFGYRDLTRGRPRAVPAEFANAVQLDYFDTRAENLSRIESYARSHRIHLAVLFDIQPRHPVLLALRRGGVSKVLSYVGAPISSPMPRWKLALKRLELSLSRSVVDAVIFESQAMAELGTHGRGLHPAMVEVVPLGVDIARYHPEASSYVYDVLGFPRDRKVVVYAGHMEPRKGVAVLVEAAIELLTRRRRDDVCFLLLGNREGESATYERTYAGLGVDELIRFGGYRSDLSEIYPSCFCGVLPSTGWDSFTYGSLEMAACGLPIVASRLQGLAEAVLDQKTGLLFEPGDATELADRLEWLLDNPEEAARLGRAGRLRCEQELSCGAQLERFLGVLRGHLSRAR